MKRFCGSHSPDSGMVFFRSCILVLCIQAIMVSTGRQVYCGESQDSERSGGIIGLFQEYISPVDGDRCPMNPSCSAYARQCIKKHGPVMGIIMAMDRLVRCGRDEAYISERIYKNGHVLIHDPVENNDFWWSEP